MSDTVSVSAADIRAVSAVFTLAVAACGPNASQVPGFEAALSACTRMLAAAQDGGMPEDPVTSIDQMAVTHHEMKAAYERSGFTPEEAFTIVLTYITANASASAMRSLHG